MFLLIYLANQRSSSAAVCCASAATDFHACACSLIDKYRRHRNRTCTCYSSACHCTGQRDSDSSCQDKSASYRHCTSHCWAIVNRTSYGRCVTTCHPGPGTEYDLPIARLRLGTIGLIIGWNEVSHGTRWWKIDSPSGWVSSEFIDERGCLDCAPKVNP